MLITLLKNIGPGPSPAVVSFLAATPKPRLVKLKIAAAGSDPFSIAGSGRAATHYVVKVELGGVAGIVAPLIGKQPPLPQAAPLSRSPAFVGSGVSCHRRPGVAHGSREPMASTAMKDAYGSRPVVLRLGTKPTGIRAISRSA